MIKKPSLDREMLENYWPMSNLPFISKILEKVVATCLEGYLNTHKLHKDLQSTTSMETALVNVH